MCGPSSSATGMVVSASTAMAIRAGGTPARSLTTPNTSGAVAPAALPSV